MSRLVRSIANTLQIDDDDTHHPFSIADHDHPQFSNQRVHIHQHIQNLEINDHDPTGSVKEDLSELTESLSSQLRGVASFLAPPSPIRHQSTDNFQSDLDYNDPYLSGEDDDRVSNSAYDGLRFEVNYGTLSSPASNQIENIQAVGIRDEALAFARNISRHPETWLDFPLSEEEDDDDFEMSDTQWNHITAVERLSPRLAALRIELCPVHMSESYFWKVYFVLLHPRLIKHDADLLSTPQIVAARGMWMKELQKRNKQKLELSEKSTSQIHVNSFTDHDLSTALESSSANVSCEPTRDKSVIQEVGSTKMSLEHMLASFNTIRIEDDFDDDDDDDWIHENSELNGYVGPDVQFGTDEDISFSDLEEDDDCNMPIRSKIMK